MKLFSTVVFCGFLLVGGIFLKGCGNTTSSSATLLTISGTMATTTRDHDKEIFSRAVYAITCVTLQSPVVSGSGTIDSNTLKFSISFDPAGQPFGCFVSKDGVLFAALSFLGSSTGLNGQTTAAGSYVAGGGGSMEMGTVTLNLTTGQATVNSSGITGTAANTTNTGSGTWVALNGAYTVSSCKNAITGAACSRSEERDGPPSSLYFHQMGPATGGGGTHYGLAVWKDAASYTGCGSREGITLPSGWTTSDTTLTNAFTFDSFDTSFANYKARDFGGGKTACNATYSTNMLCSAIAGNTGNWGNGTITFSTADCKAQCAASAVSGGGDSSQIVTSTCPARFMVDWSKVQSASATGQLSTCTTSGCGTSAAAGYISRQTSPTNRFVANELVITGDSATVTDNTTNTQYACVRATPSATNCTQIACDVTEHVNLAIKETSATTATILVNINTTVSGHSPTTSTACLDNSGGDNYIAQRVSTPQAFVMTVTK